MKIGKSLTRLPLPGRGFCFWGHPPLFLSSKFTVHLFPQMGWYSIMNEEKLLIFSVATRRCVVATVFWWYAIGKNRMLVAKGGH